MDSGMKKKGLFICIEGLDQSGKKTQAMLLSKILKNQGYEVEKITFPDYNTPIGKEIKAFLSGKRQYDVQVGHMLYAINRWEKRGYIETQIKNGKYLVTDRYYQSNLAYGLANGLNLDWLLNLERGLPEPDLVIVIDVSPDLSFKRKSRKRDLYERDLTFLKKVREVYIELSRKFKWITINGEAEIDKVKNNIWRIVEEYLN
jgi:dTMP kinase